MKIQVAIILFVLGLFFLTSCDNAQTVNTETPSNETDTISAINTMGSPLIEELSKKIAAAPQNAVFYAERGEIYYDKDNYEAAIQDFLAAIRLDSTNYDYGHALADAYLDNYQSEEAIKVLETVAEKAPDRLNTLLKLSEFQLILKQNKESLETIDKILKQSPRHPEGFYMLGMNYKATGDTSRAINGFQTAVEEDPDHLDAYVQLGLLFDRLNRPISLKYFDNALRIDSINLDAIFGKAWYYHQRNQYEQAGKWYEKASRFYPKNSQIHLNYGILHLELSNIYKKEEEQKKALETAYKKFDLASKVNPSFGLAYYYLGLSLERLGDKKKAVRNYRQAAALMDNRNKANQALLKLGERPIMK